MRRLFLVVSLLAFVANMSFAAAVGRIKVVGVPDRLKSANAGEATYGLKTVGKGSRVVLAAEAYSTTGFSSSVRGQTVVSATWTLTGPGGSVATIQDTAAGGNNGLIVYFVPDVVGSYTVGMTATTDTAGTAAPVSITIKASNFKGAGNYSSATQSYENSPCAGCHQGLTPEIWASFPKTNHASAVNRKLDEAGGHFGNSCWSCHSIGYNKSATAVNDGFDDRATDAGFTTTPTNHPGVYDSLVAAQPLMMAASGIQCENCHGPANEHLSNPSGMAPDASWSSEVCGPCHFSSDRHPKGYSWDASAHANSVGEGAYDPYHMNSSRCAYCHVGQGFVREQIEGQASLAPYNDPAPVTCQACHDPHDAKNPMQLRKASVATACTGCHITRLSGQSGLHHAHQGPMLSGVDAEAYNGANTPVPNAPANVGPWSGWELPGYTYQNGTHSEIPDRCVECHMAQTPTYDPTFAKPDTLLNRLGGHTFKIVWNHDTPDDETDDILNPVGCRECHGEVSLEYVRLSQDNIKGLLLQLKAVLPLRSDSTPVFPQNLTDLRTKAASYNYYFVNNEGSFGVHNHTYAKQLLESSIEQMKLGAGADTIFSVKDIPSDQGRQVQVVWNKFPSEGFSFDRLTKYGIWRKDPNLGPTTAVKVKNFTEMMTAGPVGTQAVMAGFVWTYLGDVPATNLSQYSYVAPTLKDSTVSGGMYWSTYYVAGYTADNKALYASPVDSGYSVDNLRPVTPTGLAAANSPAGVRLTWNAPTDPDVDNYIVYRGALPLLTSPLGTVKGTEYIDNTANNGSTYFYKIVAVDFAGNKSTASDLVSLLVSDVKSDEGVPTDFALKQNFPNPFNPSTEIAFAVPKAVHVRLSVYTISGELVATLVDQEMSAGNYTATWNAHSVASGLYLYRIQAGDFSAVKKMVLVK